MRKTEDEICLLLKHDPEQGMTLIVEQYTGLLWKVIQQYLTNPEDIKDCLHDTFTEFFIHQDRFDPSKGTLTAFLASIARKRAISLYRKNRVRYSEPLSEAHGAGGNPFGKIEEHLDLEKVMAELSTDELQIIRMKYYDGMTVQEIAQSLQLPYETVKKRHQRSIKKLRNMLLFVLALILAAILTACALNILQRFGILPRYGISQNAEVPVYELDENNPVSVENELMTIEILEAVYLNDSLTGKYQVTLKDSTWAQYRSGDAINTLSGAGTAAAVPNVPALGFELRYEGEALSGVTTSNYDPDAATEVTEFSLSDAGLETDGKDSLEFVIHTDDMDLPFTLKSVTAQKLDGYSISMTDEGGLLAIPRLENGELIVAIYPLNVGEFEIVPALIRDHVAQNKTDDVTATAEDGTVLIGNAVGYHPGSTSTYYEWNFGAASPGTYRLNIPYVFQTVEPTDTFEIPINLETMTWEDTVYKMPGGHFSIQSAELVEIIPADSSQAQYSEEGELVYEPTDTYHWLIRFSMESDLAERQVTTLPLTPVCEMINQGDGLLRAHRSTSITVNIEEQTMEFLDQIPPEQYDTANYHFTYGSVPGSSTDTLVYRWNHSFDFTFTVEES